MLILTSCHGSNSTVASPRIKYGIMQGANEDAASEFAVFDLQIQLHPTPPSTAESRSLVDAKSTVDAALRLLRKRQEHRLTGPATLRLKLSEYRNFLLELEKNPALKGFVEDKVRSVHTYSKIRAQCLTITDWTIPPSRC